MNLQEAKELHNLLFTFIGIFQEKFLCRYRRHYDGNLRIKKNHFRIISILYQYDPLISTEIGKMLDIEKGSLTTLINQLEEMGLVIRCADTHDRRKSLISLTTAGRDEMNKIMDKYIRYLSASFHGIEPVEVEQFTASLLYALKFMKKL